MNKPIRAALAFAAALLAPGSAFAHAHLQSAAPAADAVVKAAPASLVLDFSEGLEIGLSGVALKGPDGRPVATGAVTLTPGNDREMSVPIGGALGAGTYTVEWHALSRDGHTTHGTYRFTVSP
jgi:methionine-rich copper-binding protein CopC